ncbi:MAG: serine hydrolase domain-containing protein [Planctomycetota bacterium]
MHSETLGFDAKGLFVPRSRGHAHRATIHLFSRLAFISVILLSSALPGQAQGPWRPEVEALLNSMTPEPRGEQPGFPGFAAAVIHRGKLSFVGTKGMANLEHQVPIGSTTSFRIGSTSKQFTATAIALLHLDGDIKLDDLLTNHFPKLAQAAPGVLISDLVHHTSGITDYLVLAFLNGNSDQDIYSVEDSFSQLCQQRDLMFEPGTKFYYSNSNYFLLSLLVQRISGQSLADFAAKRIFKPLGMKNSRYRKAYDEIIPNRAHGYRQTKAAWRIANTQLDHTGDGGVFTTIEDLAKWDANFYDNKLGHGKALIDLLQRRGCLRNGDPLDYAFGLVVDRHRGRQRVAHGGAFVGFRADYVRFPELETSVVCLGNYARSRASIICSSIVDIVLRDSWEPLEKRKQPSQPFRSHTKAPPLPDPKPQPRTASPMASYNGEYVCEALRVPWTIEAISDTPLPGLRFVIGHNRIQLSRARGDHFGPEAFRCLFRRNQHGDVTGFGLYSGLGFPFEFKRKDKTS